MRENKDLQAYELANSKLENLLASISTIDSCLLSANHCSTAQQF